MNGSQFNGLLSFGSSSLSLNIKQPDTKIFCVYFLSIKTPFSPAISNKAATMCNSMQDKAFNLKTYGAARIKIQRQKQLKLYRFCFVDWGRSSMYECNNKDSKLTSKQKWEGGERAEMTAAAAASASKLGCVSKSALNCYAV